MPQDFIKDSGELLRNLPPLTGDAARLAHRLSRAIIGLQVMKLYSENNRTITKADFDKIMEEI